MIYLDGSQGGGQMLRSALALSTLSGTPFRMHNIRKSRPSPGLKPQHLACIKALSKLCDSKSDGNAQGSDELLYVPGTIQARNITLDIGTAGSITLLLQSLLLPCLFAPRPLTLNITGGTDVAWSMPIDYFTEVVIPQYRRVADIDVQLLKRGYYPKGGGRVKLRIKPDIIRNEFDDFAPFLLALKHKRFTLKHKGHVISIHGISHASADLATQRVAERQAFAAKQKLKHLGVPMRVDLRYSQTLSTGSGITLWAICSLNKNDLDPSNPIRIGADALGRERKPSEEVGEEAADKLLRELVSGAPIDSHLADNLIPLIGLCRPSVISTTQITDHVRTNIAAAQAFLGDIYQIKEQTISTTDTSNSNSQA